MKKKRFLKLCMGLGIQKRDAEYYHEESKIEENQTKFEMLFVQWLNVIDVKHPAYERRLEDMFSKWAEMKMSDGQAVRIAGRCYQATKDMVVIDRRKK